MQIFTDICGSVVPPSWLSQSDHTDDALQDEWIDATDPENERGEVITAHYARTNQERECPNDPRDVTLEPWLDLIGVEIDGDHGKRYASRFELTDQGIYCPNFDRWEDE